MKTLKNIIAAGIASAFLAFSSPVKAGDFEYGLRFSLNPRMYSVDLNESKKVPVHPDDSSFLHGDTEIKAKNSHVTSCGLDIGAELRETWKNRLSVLGGVDLETEETGGDSGNYGESGMWNRTKQSSDTRPDAGAAFVYDKVEPESFSLIPFIGAGIKGSKCFADLEYALITREFRREWGHHRYGKENKTGREKYSTSGNRLALKLGIINERDFRWGLQLIQEDYGLEKSSGDKAGKLECYSIGLFLTKTF